MQYALEIENLCKHYDDFDLRDVSIKVPEGQVVGLVGSNGAGKTTILKSALGIIGFESGNIKVLGRELKAGTVLSDEVKSRIGVVLDSCAFPSFYRVKDVAILGKEAYREWNQKKWVTLAERFELPANKNVSDLSRGMGMKLSLAFALSHEPELLILDEATAGLDPMARDEVLDLLRDFMLQDGHSILISSHITTDLEKIADAIVCLDSGNVVFSVSKEAITDEAGIAHLRATDLNDVLESSLLQGCGVHLLEHGHQIDVLVPDRFDFARAFPEIVVEKAGIDDYMMLVLKGEER